jgi:AraC-like DNA-binding protein
VAEGESFGAILDKLRSDLAARYLQSEELSMSQIAWLLGYTEQSSFVRAVQRWTGKSPRNVRRSAASQATKKPRSRRD